MTRARDIASGADFSTGIDAGEVLPHIIPGVLYPAIAGKLLDGSTSHGATYGVAQSDGRSYYYTDIKGSKPIKDPRIGGHFGSQRHMCKSIQLLEQETATHGKNVYSVDGREWFRAVAGDSTDWVVKNDNGGNFIYVGDPCTSSYIEIVGYFNDFNTLVNTGTDSMDDIDIKVNGAVGQDANTLIGGRASVYTPLGLRYVNKHSVINCGATLSTALGTTPAINTIKIEATNGGGEYFLLGGIELIAQDTSSTANKSKIQIPSQNVVSYGKKFTVSGTPHYDPFNGFTSGNLAAVQALIDTDTSLGMANWLSSSTYYRPFNGGRVVKWVDSSGNIKTSVTMMPPNAQNIGGTASNAIDLSSSQTNDDTINFNTSGIDHSLSEVAKQYYWSEFGNGSANASDGGSWKDWSMNNASSHERAYVMDDGLTSLLSDHAVFGTNAENDVLGCRIAVDTGVQNTYFTFIGTGISAELKEWDSGAKFNAVGFQTLAQNLPYGTHIIKIARDNTGTDQVTLLVDGVSAQVEAFNVDHNALETLRFMAFHQPKKPPIPEDAVVLADYCLFADYVATSTGAVPNISKGVRRISSSRDIFYDASSGTPALAIDINKNMGFQMTAGSTPSADVFQGNLPAFATIMEANGYGDRRQIYVDGGSAEAQTVVGSSYGTCTKMNSAKTLGLYTFKSKNKASTDGDLDAIDVATPIHTSSHYQTFETPFLKELVGGDRNMEQHNLIVTPDGKSWDEVTRDTSYIGNVKMRTNLGNEQSITNPLIWTEWRGKASGGDIDGIDKFNKDFAITRDRGVICLVPGNYQITWWVYINMDDAAGGYTIYVNGTIITQNYSATPASGKTNSLTIVASPYLYRGDYITMGGTSAISQQNFEIIKV